MTQEIDERRSQISKWLIDSRRAAKLSQTEAGEAIGVSRKTIERWELGRHAVDGEALLRLASVYKTPVPEFWDDVVPRGTGSEGDVSWSPNPALINKIPRRPYDVAIGYCRRLHSAGWPREEIEQIERLMIDPRYAQANKRKGQELTEDEFIMLIDATWEAVKHSAAAMGRQV